MTGGLFGLSTAWFGYPYVMESVEETRKSLHIKQAIVRQINQEKVTH